MTLDEYRTRVRALAGYDPYREVCWGAEAGASSVQLFTADRLTPGYPALTLAEAEALVGRRARSEELGRYTICYFGALYAVEPVSSVGEFEPEDQ